MSTLRLHCTRTQDSNLEAQWPTLGRQEGGQRRLSLSTVHKLGYQGAQQGANAAHGTLTRLVPMAWEASFSKILMRPRVQGLLLVAQSLMARSHEVLSIPASP